jgi:hypothetical protein
MRTNLPKPVQIDKTGLTANDAFVVSGVQGYYARVTVIAKYTGTATITITNPAESTTLDTQTSATQCILGYLIDNLTKDRYNVIASTVTPYAYRVIIEYHRTTGDGA